MKEDGFQEGEKEKSYVRKLQILEQTAFLPRLSSLLQATLPCAVVYQVHTLITVFITLCCDLLCLSVPLLNL